MHITSSLPTGLAKPCGLPRIVAVDQKGITLMFPPFNRQRPTFRMDYDSCRFTNATSHGYPESLSSCGDDSVDPCLTPFFDFEDDNYMAFDNSTRAYYTVDSPDSMLNRQYFYNGDDSTQPCRDIQSVFPPPTTTLSYMPHSPMDISGLPPSYGTSAEGGSFSQPSSTTPVFGSLPSSTGSQFMLAVPPPRPSDLFAAYMSQARAAADNPYSDSYAAMTDGLPSVSYFGGERRVSVPGCGRGAWSAPSDEPDYSGLPTVPALAVRDATAGSRSFGDSAVIGSGPDVVRRGSTESSAPIPVPVPKPRKRLPDRRRSSLQDIPNPGQVDNGLPLTSKPRPHKFRRGRPTKQRRSSKYNHHKPKPTTANDNKPSQTTNSSEASNTPSTPLPTLPSPPQSSPPNAINNTKQHTTGQPPPQQQPQPSSSPSTLHDTIASAACANYPHYPPRDAFILQARDQGLTYKTLKQIGHLAEAESTLRGRHRVLTKAAAERVRRPVWRASDDELLCEAVDKLATPRGRLGYMPWGQISGYVADQGASYGFSAMSCRRRWCQLVAEKSAGGCGADADAGSGAGARAVKESGRKKR